MAEVINVKILHLVVKKKWYEMQESGEKTPTASTASPSASAWGFPNGEHPPAARCLSSSITESRRRL